jgi:hypothetical protein
MTTAGPDRPFTAADLLFGPSADAPRALTRQIMSAGQAENLGRALRHLPRATRQAAAREATAAAAVLLKVDLIELLVTGWREHRDIMSAARRTLAAPASQEIVGLAAHRISTIQQPSVGVLIDGHQVHTLRLGLSIIFDVTALVAVVKTGRLAGVHSGRCQIGVALTVHEIEVLTKRAHLELPGVVALRSGFRLLPASAYPSSHFPGSGHPAGQFPGVELQASEFPSVELQASQVPGTEHPSEYLGAEQPSEHAGAEHPSGSAGGEHPGNQDPGSQHPSSDESHHPSSSASTPWWESVQPRHPPTRTE